MRIQIILIVLFPFIPMMVSCDAKTSTVDACGDGFVDPGEQCDGDIGQNSCISLGYYDPLGTLSCTQSCQFDTTTCGGRCGDELVQGAEGETCDGGNLNGQSCQSLGYTGGVLACSLDCAFDVSGCAGRCGNGVIDAEDGEVCDGMNLAGETCQSQGYHGGQLECTADCSGYNLDSCIGVGRCGDGVIQATFGEVCDGSNLDGQSCESLHHYLGTLACDPDTCQFLFDGCAGLCGDGLIQPGFGEVCDGADLGLATCASVGYYDGLLACDSNCQLYVAGCGGRCGDQIIQGEQGEECDDSNLGGQTCATQGFVDGALVCDGACRFDRGGCTMHYTSPNLGVLVYVPGGTFQRDDTATNLSQVSAFRMSKYEITRLKWTSITGWPDPSSTTYSPSNSYPVQNVNWYHAIAFCNKLSLLEGLMPVYAVSGVDFGSLTYAQIPLVDDATWNAVSADWEADGYRLPTEMEWMWAAMGADTGAPGATNTTGHAKAFAGSTGTNAIGNYAVFGWVDIDHELPEDGATPTRRANVVGSKLPNELGIHDLSGNVWEWVWDWYAAGYPSATVLDYRGPATGTSRVSRGGHWESSSGYCAVQSRIYAIHFSGSVARGFRVVRR